MNKKSLFLLVLVGIGIVGANEFTKKPNRRDKAQHEAVYEDCLQGMNRVIELSCHAQAELAQLMGDCYKNLRSCAVEEKPALGQIEALKLKTLCNALQSLEKQLQELTRMLADGALFPLKKA